MFLDKSVRPAVFTLLPIAQFRSLSPAGRGGIREHVPNIPVATTPVGQPASEIVVCGARTPGACGGVRDGSGE